MPKIVNAALVAKAVRSEVKAIRICPQGQVPRGLHHWLLLEFKIKQFIIIQEYCHCDKNWHATMHCCNAIAYFQVHVLLQLPV